MTTPVLIVSILFLPLLASWVIGGNDRVGFGGVLGIAFAFVFFAVGHYAQTGPMAEMLPEFVPFRRQVVLATGALEVFIAAGILHPATRRLAGIAAIAVLVAFFPANIYAAINHVGMGGHAWGPVYLLIRAPLQMLLIVWAWLFLVRRPGPAVGPAPGHR